MKYVKWVIGLFLGSAIGFAYWYFIGCNTNGCAITSSPLNSSLYGALMGILFISAFPRENKHQT
ncbi:MAG TPA: DUF6132 family protein [Cyclobacteriaceae bacterium]|nr:DUF6132 family protein [Cyclobacteriaceae bacterium]